jgi:multidrug resistance efflux pump
VVSRPLVQDLDTRLGFLGQFSAVSRVELRAQVGGTLTGIIFKDGDIVRKGDLLFTIDPRPYEITLAEATAQLDVASARLEHCGLPAQRLGRRLRERLARVHRGMSDAIAQY